MLTGAANWILTWSDGVITTNSSSPATRSVNPTLTTTYTVTAISDSRGGSAGTSSGSATVTVNTVRTTVTVSDEVLIVYNSNLADSISCKDYYINNRPGFSSANVLGCACSTFGVDGFESITWGNLTNQIINPITNFIKSNPEKSIHYVVLMYGMPSRVGDGASSVQHSISHCMSAEYAQTYEGSSCPFVAANYPGTTCLVTALNMATLADCEAYIDKVKGMYSGDVIISAKASGYTASNYYLDGTTTYGYTSWFASYVGAILTVNPSASVTYSPSTTISTGSNVKGYAGWGVHNGVFPATYATDGHIVWSGSSTWWIMQTIESYNGQRDCSQGCVNRWFASNAWGGTNYSNTPVGAVSHVEEPGVEGTYSPTYMSLWEAGYLFSECAWASKSTPHFQAIGDPLVRQ